VRSLGPLGLACAIALLSASAPAPPAPEARSLVKAADDRLRGDTQVGRYRMEITTPRWSRTVEMRVWSKGTEYFLIRIDAPAEEAGTGFLKIGDEVWSYLPGVEKTIKIPPSMMHQSWMGSDFNYDDLVRESSVVNDYTQHLEGREMLDSLDTWHVRLDPKPDAPVVWGRVDVWIETDEPVFRKEVFYDQSGNVSGTLRLDDVREMGGRRIPTRWERTDAEKPENRTVLVIEEASYDRKIEDGFFGLQNLKRIR